MKIITPTPSALAISLHAFNGIISVNTFIYITALFLSSYPIEWIPYFFIGRTVIEVTTSYLIAPYLLKNSVRSALILETASIIVIAITLSLLKMHWFMLPMIFSFILTIASLIEDFITWNNTRNAFDIIEFKQLSPILSLANIIGKIVFSLANIVLIKKFGISYLPYCIALLMLLSCYCIKFLTPLPVIISTHKKVNSPIRYPLFRNLFLFSFLLAFCYTLVDYTLRHKLASIYNSQQIGQFISIFTAITYFLSTILTYFFSQPLIKLGIVNLLRVLPIYWIIVPIGVIFYPSMTMITLMGSGDYMFFNFMEIGRGLLLNVLPTGIKTVSQVSIKKVSESVGIAAASLFLILIANYITLPKIAFCIFVCSTILIIYTRRLHINYISTLKSEILLKRFTVDESDIGPDINTILKYNLEECAPLVISRLAKGGVYYSARKFINKLGDKAIPLLSQAILENKDSIRVRNDLLISLLAQIHSSKVDDALIELIQLPEIVIKQALAFETLVRATHFRLSDKLTSQAFQAARDEAELIHVLRITLKSYSEDHIKQELIARINLALERFLSWIGVYTNSSEVHGIIPSILHGHKLDQANAIELLSTLIPDRDLAQITLDIFSDKCIEEFKNLSKPIHLFYDVWIAKVIKTPFIRQAGQAMNQMQKIFILRQVDLFKNLPAEALMIIAEEIDTRSMLPEQIIFSENDPPTDLFIIASGTVHIIRQNVLLAELKDNDFFGELALIDNAPRTANAIAKSEGYLLVLHKEIFERIINDLPQVLLSVTQSILRYLRSNLANHK